MCSRKCAIPTWCGASSRVPERYQSAEVTIGVRACSRRQTVSPFERRSIRTLPGKRGIDGSGITAPAARDLTDRPALLRRWRSITLEVHRQGVLVVGARRHDLERVLDGSIPGGFDAQLVLAGSELQNLLAREAARKLLRRPDG